MSKMRGCRMQDVLEYDTRENTFLFDIARRNDVIPHLRVVTGVLFHVLGALAGAEGHSVLQRMVDGNRYLQDAVDAVAVKDKGKKNKTTLIVDNPNF